MAGKSTIQVEVLASTQKASNKIKLLQNELQQSTAGRAIGNLESGLKDIGLGDIGGKIGDVAKLGGKLTALASGAGVAAAGIGAVVHKVNQMVEAGGEAAKVASRMEVSLSTLARNFNISGAGIKEITHDLQMLSANGVNSIDDMTEAMKVLVVATKGDVAQSSEMVKSFDDIAAGTGMTVSNFAELTAKIMENGVEQRDLNRLARQGIPIYDALGKAMGVTKDEAKIMAKEGKVGIEDWNKAVKELGKNYAGLSAAMSAQTLEGAMATREALTSKAYQGAAEGYQEARIEGINKANETFEKWANNPVWQGNLKVLGSLKGLLENLGTAIGDFSNALDVRFLIKSLDFLGSFTGNAGWIDEVIDNMRGTEESMTQSDVFRTLIAAQLGTATKEAILAALSTIETKWLFFQDSSWEKRIDELTNALKELTDEEKSNAERAAAEKKTEAVRGDIMKYGTFDEKLAAASTGPYARWKIENPEMLENEIEWYKKQLTSGNYADEEVAEGYRNIIDKYTSLQKEYIKMLEDEADAKQKALDAAKKKAEEDAKYEQDLEKKRIEGKANIGRDIAKEQENLKSITDKLQELQNARSIVRAEEEHGIFREKWGNLNVSEMGSKEAELILEQQQSNQKLKELKDAYDKYDQNWATARQKTEAMADKITQGVVRVKGTALTS